MDPKHTIPPINKNHHGTWNSGHREPNKYDMDTNERPDTHMKWVMMTILSDAYIHFI